MILPMILSQLGQWFIQEPENIVLCRAYVDGKNSVYPNSAQELLKLHPVMFKEMMWC